MMISLAVLAAILTVALGLMIWLYVRAIRSLRHFHGIDDLEKYRTDCEQKAQQAISKVDEYQNHSKRLDEDIKNLKKLIVQYQQVVGDFKTAVELKKHIRNEQLKVQTLAKAVGSFRTVGELDERIREQEGQIESQRRELEKLAELIGAAASGTEIAAQIRYNQNYLAELRAEVERIEEARELQSFGYYRPKYDFDSSEAYKDRLDHIRDKQKSMLKAKTAAICDTEWTVEGSKAEGRKMVNQQIKLMLRAFNGECDAAIGKVRYNNAVSLENRIQRSFEQINKLGQTKRVHLTDQYCDSKLQELYLAHEYQEMKQAEKEEQQRIRVQMREEEKAAKEIAKACEDAEKEQLSAQEALQKAKEDLARESGKQTATLQALVARLENELKEALDRKAKAIARAQLTKSGHVYVLSNIGSFGEGVYKIGMTRRLEPLERVKELGDSSVPFYFDVHAMIYSENAPELESQLHTHFASRRVNMVNLRREFFRVSLEDIQDAVRKTFRDVTFVKVPEAEQYRQTLAMLDEMGDESKNLRPAKLQYA